jgi:uncharacterized protein (DUF2235 family)
MAQIISLVAWFIGVVFSFSAGAWWLNTIIIGLTLRWLEWHKPLREGRLRVCALVLFGLWLVFAALTVALVLALFCLADSLIGDWLASSLPVPLVHPGRAIVIFAVWLAVAVGLLAGLSKVVDAWGAAQRRREITDLMHPAPQPVDVPQPAGQGRRIVILCDGTSNRPDDNPDGESTATNIWKLSLALCNDETQTVWYEAGVGSDTSTTARQARRTQRLLSITGAAAGTKLAAIGGTLIRLIESGTGVGISETIVNGYTEIVRRYQPGDRIYLVGFSRGAFAARCIAGVISRCGLLRAEHVRYAPDVMQIYRTRADPDADVQLRPDMVYPAIGSTLGESFAHPVAIEFVGVFDTVASLGFPLWGWWFRAFPVWNNKAFSTDPAKACRNIYHALAMDERRSQFIPTLYSQPPAEVVHRPEVLKQVWFRGAHGDVGGGYMRHDTSDTPLTWMTAAMICHGLSFRSKANAGRDPNPLARLHDELVRQPQWGIFGTWPRWHPVPGVDMANQQSELHPSVLERAEAVWMRTGRPDLHGLHIGDTIEFVVDTGRDWYRTGLIIENGGVYRVEYLGGLTRDAEARPCDPGGQNAGKWDIRRFLGYGRRIPSEKWMRIGATIAHPRQWNPKEKSFSEALHYLFYSAPLELLRQVAPIGQDLQGIGATICLTSDAPSGLLYLFANDWWQTAANNTGGPHLRITRIEAPDSGRPVWSLVKNTETGTDGKPEMVFTWKPRDGTRGVAAA